jgi:hypothetical protein
MSINALVAQDKLHIENDRARNRFFVETREDQLRQDEMAWEAAGPGGKFKEFILRQDEMAWEAAGPGGKVKVPTNLFLSTDHQKTKKTKYTDRLHTNEINTNNSLRKNF